MKLQLVEDWKKAWRWFSVNAMLLAGAIQAAWIGTPDDLRAAVPAHLVQWITMALLGLGVAGRVVKQGDEKQP